MNDNKKAFTLLELLITIGIIGILAAVALVAVNPARQFGRANDTERRSEINALLKAMYQYQADPVARGALPQCLVGGTPTAIPDCDGAGTGSYDAALELGTAATNYDCSTILTPFYIREIPIDPSSTYSATDTGYYVCKNASKVYIIAAGSEVEKDGGCEVPGTTDAALCISG